MSGAKAIGDPSLVEHRSPLATKPKQKKIKRKDRKDVLAELSNPDGEKWKSGSTGQEDLAVNPEKSSMSSLSSSVASQEDDFLGSDLQVGPESAGNTKVGSITVPLTSCLTGLY